MSLAIYRCALCMKPMPAPRGRDIERGKQLCPKCNHLNEVSNSLGELVDELTARVAALEAKLKDRP